MEHIFKLYGRNIGNKFTFTGNALTTHNYVARGRPFKPGNSGRPAGTQNKLTKSVKETVLAVFNDLQEDKINNLMAFAKLYPRDFYQIAAKLIPTDLKAELSGPDGEAQKFEITLKI